MRLAIPCLLVATVISFAACGSGTNDEDVTGNDVTDQETAGDVLDQDTAAEDAATHDTAVDDTASDVADLDIPEVTPEFDPVLAATLQSMLAEHIAFSADPGVTLTIGTADGAWWTGAAGVASLEDDRAMTPDSQFRVGSNTKPIVAVVVLQLMEEGKIDLDQPLTKYLPEYTVWSDITVRMLLNMRSGLKEFLGIQACLLSVMLQPDKAFTPAEIMQFVVEDTDNGRMFAPDTDGSYSNTNYVLLGMIVEAVTGRTITEEINDRILTPLGLENTYLDMGDAENADLVEGYIDATAAGSVVGVKPSELSMLPGLTYVDGLIVGTHLMHPTVVWASGALVSTSADMGRFVRALMRGALLKPETMDQMDNTQPASLLGGITEYGLGLQNIPSPEGETWGHGGLNFGYQTQTWYVPEFGITISHIHNFLLNWYDSFQNEVLAMVKKGGDATYVPCVAPEGFYGDGTGGVVMNMAFKGGVNAAEQSSQTYGITKFRTASGGTVTPFVGMYPAATRMEKNGKQVVMLVSYGLPATGDADVEMLAIEMSEALFTEVGEDGIRAIKQANAGDFFGVRSELYYAEGTTTINKVCYTGMSDATRTGSVFLCPGNRGAIPAAGDTLKIMASVPVTDNAEYMDYILTNIMQTTRCSCLNGTTWEACE